MTWVQARYHSIIRPGEPPYSDVEIFFDAKSLAKVGVEIVQ